MKRYSIKEIESAMNSCGFIIDRIICNDSRRVKNVKGRIPIQVPAIVSEQSDYKPRFHRIRWNPSGKAFRVRDNQRATKFDLPLNSIK